MHDHAPGKSNAVGSHIAAARATHHAPEPGRTTLAEQQQPRARGSVADLSKEQQHANAKHDKHDHAEHDPEMDEELDREGGDAHAGDHHADKAVKDGGGEVHIITRAGLRHLMNAGKEGRRAARLLYNNPNAYIVLKEGQTIPHHWKCSATVLFPSYKDFKAAVDGGKIPAFVKAVVYDNEHWQQTPPNEKTDAAHYAKLFKHLAHSHGWTFIAAPTRKWFAADAKYADIIDVQLQSRESHKGSYLKTLKHDANLAHRENPDIKVVTQISSNKNHLDPDHSGNIGAGERKAESEILESADYVDGFWGYLYQRNHKSVKAGQEILKDLADKKKDGADI